MLSDLTQTLKKEEDSFVALNEVIMNLKQQKASNKMPISQNKISQLK